ncbi:MAG: hypothetical protein JSS07_05145 [Proteobacteria bacterium]|nr:hypothetical protein [Pseudomonadota bacterium]
MMVKSSVDAKYFAQILVRGILFVPKGLLLPIVQNLDDIRELLIHDKVACAYCSKHTLLPSKYRKKFTTFTNKFFNTLTRVLYRVILKSTYFSMYILEKLFSQSFLDKIKKILIKMEIKIGDRFQKVARFLLNNRNRIVWYGLIASLLLSTCIFFWGIGIIPEIYVFIMGSIWGGKILNSIANLIVLRQQAIEWLFLKNVFLWLLGKKEPTFEGIKESKVLFRKLLLDCTLISVIGRFSQFMNYCFQAFFSWLIFYVLIKITADETPGMIHKLERYMSQHPKTKGQYYFSNAVWLASYKLFQSSCSPQAKVQYDLFHSKIHDQQAEPKVLPVEVYEQGSQVSFSQYKLNRSNKTY